MRALIRTRHVALSLAALALAGTGVAAYGAVGEAGADYRTVSATTGSVEQELDLSGTIAPSDSSELAFGTGGTVAKVRVEQGDEVAEGAVIAVLDRASLRAAVDRAASDLASAKAQLADDRDAQTSAVSSSSSSSSAASTTRSGSDDSAPAGAGSTAAVVKQLTAQQDAVLEAQTTASDALSAAETALTDQQAACADPVATTETADPATDAATDDADPGTTTTTAVLSEECTAALAAVQSAQATAAQGQTSLQTALETLGSTLVEALGVVQTGGTSSPAGPGTSDPSPTGSSAGSSTPLPASGASSGQVVTAATLAQDQAAIDRAKADLAAAKADLAGAVVRAPADGTVVSLSVDAGDDLAAGDSVATVVAPGLTIVTVEATAAQAALLEQGMDVEVTPAGATETLAGAVDRIGHEPSAAATTGSDPTYTVEIVLDDRDLQLADGMPASVTAVVGVAEDVVVVPASAVTNGSVTVVDNGVAERVPVSTGIVGARWIEVTDGLAEGDDVVLADLDAELPTGDSAQVGGFGGGFGGGGGLPAGGPPSGGFR